MTAPLLSVQSLSLSIRGTPILREVSFDVAPGQIVALTGESGSGKSLSALAVLRLLPQGSETGGAIRFDGRDLMRLSEPQMCDLRGNDIGMVFQEPMTALNPVQTIGAQITETLRLHSDLDAKACTARAREVMARVGLPPGHVDLERYPHELSGGQRQRVVIAMAIALRPKLLIADEPTTALDVTTQAQILDLLRGLVDEQDMALLMITHDLAVVSDLADRIVVMRHGAVVEQGPTQRLFAAMTHPYTRALFDASRHAADLPPPVRDARPLLEVRNVTRSYKTPRPHLFGKPGRFDAVRNVSFTLHDGERLGLVGESGCGKSTLTRALLGLDPVQAGQITLDGAPVSGTGPGALEVRRKIQVVFQDPYASFNPRHRVARLITEPFHLLPDPPTGPAREAAVAEALTAVGLRPEDADRFIHAFSGGQRQRIAIARALIIRPKLIVFDEAVSALDVQVRAQILDLMAELSRTYGLAYLFISHDLSVVRTITDRVLVMRAGEIVEQGPTQQVFDHPTHPYTQALIAAAPLLPDAPSPTDGDPHDPARSAL